MAYFTHREHFVPFYILDVDSNPVTGLLLTNFAVKFLRDFTSTPETVTLTDNGAGFYVAAYVPLTPGFYYLELFHAASDLRVEDGQEIDDASTEFGASSVTTLTQNYGGASALVPMIAHPEAFTLLLFSAADWNVGHTDPSYAVASTALDSAGNWISTPLTVTHGTYDVVAKNPAGTTFVIAANVVA